MSSVLTFLILLNLIPGTVASANEGPGDAACETIARARLKERFPEASLDKPADIVAIERGQLKYVFGENYCIYTALFANETCEKIVKTKRQCI